MVFLLKVAVVVGQVGTIWVKSYRTRQVMRTVSTIGFFALMLYKDNKKKKDYENN
jgi:exosome complex RNA-binding protein Rrp4